jgi:hypothetical protein
MPHPSIFLRSNSPLPHGLNIKQEVLSEQWNALSEISSLDLVALLSAHRWLYIRMQKPHSCIGMAVTPDKATSSAILYGLHEMSTVFNAVEVEFGPVLRYGMIYFSRIILYSSQIQQDLPKAATKPA